MSFILIVIGLVLLIKCADIFVDSCSNVARALGIPSLIIGLTIVAFGTSAPEAAVSVTASLKGMNDISLGNVVGSNICNLLLVLGVGGLFGTLTTKRKIITRDFIYVILSGIIMLIISSGFILRGQNSEVITRIDGVILLLFLVIYLYSLARDALKSSREQEGKTKFNPKDILYIIIGITGIIIGGQLVVNSATDIANMLNISQNVIALTIIAIGTSLPELVTSSVAVRKGESDIAIGNVVGSNIFNIFFILGISITISPITYVFESFIYIIIMFSASILVYILILKDNKIDRKKGILLLSAYIMYMVYILMR